MKYLIAASLLLAAMSFSGGAEAQDERLWQRGPATGAIGDNSAIETPADHVFLDAKTIRYVVRPENIPSDGEHMFAPTSGDRMPGLFAHRAALRPTDQKC